MISIYSKFQSDLKVSPNFKVKELLCDCCNTALVHADLPLVLEALRAILGRPIRINSGYRCPKHNLEVGGALRSTHLGGMAADCSWHGFELNDIVKTAIRGIPQVHGIGWGKDFVHVDVDASRIHQNEWTY